MVTFPSAGETKQDLRTKSDRLKAFKGGDLLDPQASAWMNQLTDLFERDAPLVHMPLAEDQFPCPSTLVVNYGRFDTQVGSGEDGMRAWFTPCGVPSAPGQGQDPSEELDAISFTDSLGRTCKPGVVLKPMQVGANPEQFAVAGILQHGTFGIGDMPNSVNSSTGVGLAYEDLTSPFMSGNGFASNTSTGQQFRTAAFGVRVTYVGRLADTEGYVEHYAPAEYAYGGESSFQRRDQAYRLRTFGVQKTHEFYWTPNCDEIRYSLDMGSGSIPGYTLTSRFGIQIGGMQTGDKVRIEYICVQEWAGNKAIPTQIPRSLTPDATHMVNAITLHRGAHHVEEDAIGKVSRPKRLTTLASGIKALSHPWLHKAISAAPDAINNVKAAHSAASKVYSVIAGLLA